MKFPFLTEDQRDEIYRDISRDTILSALEMKTDLLIEYIRKYLDNIGNEETLESLKKECLKVVNFKDMDDFFKLLKDYTVEEEKFIKVEIKDDYKNIFNIDKKERWNKELDTSLAISALIQGKISFAKAAYLANKEIYELIFILKESKLDWEDYIKESMEDEEEELLRLKKYKYLQV